MILIIDNYDSFTYNLVQYVGAYGETVVVRRNDAVTILEIDRLGPSKIIVSPGPGTPDQAGITLEAIVRFGSIVPILGVCLGHQAIGQAFGARVVHAPRLMHGKTSSVFHNGAGLHAQVPSPFQATRYHSLALDPGSIPAELRVTAWTDDGEVMGIEHVDFPVYGLQYHPESFLTPFGRDIVQSFLRISSDEEVRIADNSNSRIIVSTRDLAA